MGTALEFTGDDAQDDELLRFLLAVGVIAGDLSASEIARFASVHPSTAQRGVEIAIDKGFLGSDGVIADDVADELVGDLTTRQVAELHADVARHLFTIGPERVADAVRHARAAGSSFPPGELIVQARKVGFLCLSLNDWEGAEHLFRLAIELSPLVDQSQNTLQLRFLAVALNAMGRLTDARDVLLQAGEIAIVKGDWR